VTVIVTEGALEKLLDPAEAKVQVHSDAQCPHPAARLIGAVCDFPRDKMDGLCGVAVLCCGVEDAA
jgi:hypothetical protein